MRRIGFAGAIFVLATLALSACGGNGDDSDGGGGDSVSATLSAADVEACFKGAGATVEHTNEASVEAQKESFGFAQTFQGTLEGGGFDGFIENDEDAIAEVQGKVEEALTELTDNPSDYVLVKNNGMIVFDATTGKPPDSKLKSVAEDCLAG